jgi:hypothetical protein
MDALMNQLARELADAISAAVAADARVEACREKARAAGYDLRVSLEASVGFASRSDGAAVEHVPARKSVPRSQPDMTANDRRFLKSLRIAADETAKEVE